MREETILKFIIGIIVSIILFVSLDTIGAKTSIFTATVLEKHYQPSSRSTGTGVSSSGNVVTTSEYNREKFILIVKSDLGNIFSVESNSKTYVEVEIGEKIQCVHKVGLLTGDVVSTRTKI